LDNRIFLHQGSALALSFSDATFDRAYMLHVGMLSPVREELKTNRP